VAWCFEDETTPFTERVLDLVAKAAEVLVPAIWPFELSNALLTAERRKRITLAQTTSMLTRIAAFPIAVEPPRITQVFDQILSAARQRNLTAYDAAYLELALRRGVPLATLDDDLRTAATAAGIKLIL
jgi:predicted nucleic acid-binding protein